MGSGHQFIQKRICVDTNSSPFWNMIASKQTYGVVLANKKNSVEKLSFVMILCCTDLVWQNLRPSSPSSSPSKRHFLKFLSQVRNYWFKEGRIEIVCENWKSAVFSKSASKKYNGPENCHWSTNVLTNLDLSDRKVRFTCRSFDW